MIVVVVSKAALCLLPLLPVSLQRLCNDVRCSLSCLSHRVSGEVCIALFDCDAAMAKLPSYEALLLTANEAKDCLRS